MRKLRNCCGCAQWKGLLVEASTLLASVIDSGQHTRIAVCHLAVIERRSRETCMIHFTFPSFTIGVKAMVLK
jgi:hypothetical protein